MGVHLRVTAAHGHTQVLHSVRVPVVPKAALGRHGTLTCVRRSLPGGFSFFLFLFYALGTAGTSAPENSGELLKKLV